MLAVLSAHVWVGGVKVSHHGVRTTSLVVIAGILTNISWPAFLEALNHISIGQADLIANT